MKPASLRMNSVVLSAMLVAFGGACLTPARGQLSLLPGDTTTAPAASYQTAPAVAQGGNLTLAVWTDNRANPYGDYAWSEYETSRDIYGMRFDANGNPLDALPFVIFNGRSIQDSPKVAWNGSNWLVVFESYDLGGTGYYYQKSLAAVRVEPSGQVLDGSPIKLFGLTPLGGSYWALASDGANWVVVNQSNSTSSDIVAVRISPQGVLLDPPTRTLVTETYYLRSNVQLAYAGGVFLMTFDGEYNNGTNDTKAVRFNSSLNLLDAGPITFLPTPVSRLASNGSSFYVVWNRQEPDFSVHVVGSRVSALGQRLDGDGVNLSGTKQPSGYSVTSVAWDGLNWRVTWGDGTTTWSARVTSAGAVLDPGSVAVPGPQTGLTTGTGNGGVQLVWSEFADSDYNVLSANIYSQKTATPNRVLSIGAPRQTRPDVATSGNGYMVAYYSANTATARVLAQPLDAAGNPLTAQPIELETGPSVNGPGRPNVAWNGAAYLVAWGSSNGIVAQRLSPTGAKLDTAPFFVMAGAFGPADVAALGSDFLVAGRKISFSIQYIVPVAARVSGAGAVLDASPLVLGNSYVATAPAAVALGGRWLVAWHRNATHDDPYCISMGSFIPPTGAPTAEFQIHGPFSTAGGNGIFEVGLGSNGDKALFVQSQELTSGVENDMLCRVIDATGVVGPAINLTPWDGNQYRPRVAWDGTNFIIAYQEQRNRLAPWTLDQLDARSDLYAMRVSPTGTKLDPQGFVFSAVPTAETDPTICAANGTLFLAGALMINDATFANYRIAYDILPGNGPRAVINASTISGDIPLTVNFEPGDQFGVPLTDTWDFGDGTTSTFPSPSHTFTVAGEYLVTLTVNDEFGHQTTQAQMINATEPNQMPIAVATADIYTGTAPLDVILYADGSYDPDGFLGNIEWRFSDGGYTYGSPGYHTFTTIGTHTVTLIVGDSRGAVSTATLSINITGFNQPPVARASGTPSSGNAPLTVQFSSAGSTDPDGTILEYYWTFGDAFGTHSSEPNPTYTYGYAGTYTATLTVWDNNNVASNSANVVITVSPDPTTILRSTGIALSAKQTGTKVTVKGQVTVNDGNGTPVSDATVSVRWTRPDGTTAVQSATTGRNGVAQFQTSGRRGTYTLTVTDVYKYLYTFDAAGSVLNASITR